MESSLGVQEDFLDSKEDFGELCGGMFGGDSIKSSSTSPLEDALLADPDSCGMCGEGLVVPRVLSCLHVFCEQCLERKLMNDGGDAGGSDTSIVCPTCSQETKVGPSKLISLPLDVTTANVTDLPPATTTSTTPSIQCTSCTTKEPAVSRCATCHQLLCANCDKAHRFMRLFETHRVASLEELRREGRRITVHRPVRCDAAVHRVVVEEEEESGGGGGGGDGAVKQGEEYHVSGYCTTCVTACCGECLKREHKGHQTEGLQECEVRIRQELENLVSESRAKIKLMSQTSTDVNGTFEELAHQRSTAKDLINESCQSYKAILEKLRDVTLEELSRLYQERELKVMDMTEKVGKEINSLEDACAYATKLLDGGTVAEIMYLRATVVSQLRRLLTSPPPGNHHYTVAFHTDLGHFEHVARRAFGAVTTETTAANAAASAAANAGLIVNHVPVNMNQGIAITGKKHMVSENGGGLMHGGLMHSGKMALAPLIINGSTNGVSGGGSVSNTSPISLPASSMQSSFDSDLNNLQNMTMTQSPPVQQQQQQQPPMGNSLQGFSSIAEFNIAQLASLAENTTSGSTTAASPTTPFLCSDLFQNDTVYKNLQSLAKLGLGNNPDNNQSNNTNTPNNQQTPNTNNMLVRANSPSLTLSSQLLNGFNAVSSSTSPLLSNTPDDMGGGGNGDLMNGGGGGTGSTGSGNGSGSQSAVNRLNKVSPMQIRCKFGQLGAAKGQFNSPHGFCLGLEEDIVVADTNNHRIQVFEKTGTFKFQFGIAGKDEGQLWYPRKVAVMRSCGKYVVCDRGNERSRMQIFTKNGHFLKKIAIRYIDIVAGLAVTATGEIVAVDSVSPTVFVISENGDLLRWFDCSDYMREPSDIAIHGKEFYVCDFKGHNVVVFSDAGTYKRRIGWETITSYPNGIDISDAGDVLIGDSHGNRFHVAVFSRDGPLISEFECPYVKVSRCCGLKITSEGYVVTLAKNNHHVLVLNTLYIL